LIERLRQGDSIALVSDAGTPVLSDPGAMLVAAAHEAGIRVEPVPGPSAALAALSASGAVSDGFVFVGFAPSRSTARKRWLAGLAEETRAIVMFEAPHRIRALLSDLEEALGPRIVTVGRELTKMHEELVTQPISAHVRTLREARGEFTLVIHPPAAPESPGIASHGAVAAGQIRDEFGVLTNNKAMTRREALRVLSAKHHMPSRDIYKLLEQTK